MGPRVKTNCLFAVADVIIGREEGARKRAGLVRLVTEAVLVWRRERAEQRAGNRARMERSAGPFATQANQPLRAGGFKFLVCEETVRAMMVIAPECF